MEIKPQPPEGFRAAGRVLSASFSEPPVLRRKRYTGRRRAGILYERKVHEYLHRLFPGDYIDSPWLRFFPAGEGARWRWCQPDGLIINGVEGRITIVEVKYQHTSDAWWQVTQLYLPVLRAIFPERLWKIDFCEVVKWYDPATPFPVRTVLAAEPGLALAAFKVHIWRP